MKELRVAVCECSQELLTGLDGKILDMQFYVGVHKIPPWNPFEIKERDTRKFVIGTYRMHADNHDMVDSLLPCHFSIDPDNMILFTKMHSRWDRYGRGAAYWWIKDGVSIVDDILKQIAFLISMEAEDAFNAYLAAMK